MDDMIKPVTTSTPKPVTSDAATPSIAERMSIPVSHHTSTAPTVPKEPSDDVVKRTAPIVQPIHDDVVPPPSADVNSLADLDEPTPTNSTEPSIPDSGGDNAPIAFESKSVKSPTPPISPASVEPTASMPEASTDETADPPIEEKSSEVPVKPTPEAIEEPKFEAKVMPASTDRPAAQKGRGVVILIAVIFALALVAGAAYAYVQNKKEVTKATSTAAPATKTPAKNPATAKDVEKTSSDIDASLKKVNDTTDYQASDLSDTTLGL